MASSFQILIDSNGALSVNGETKDFWRVFATLILLAEETQYQPNTIVTAELLSLPRLALMLHRRGYTLKGEIGGP